MYYYEIYVENNIRLFTYKSEEKYEIGQWCIVNFVNRDKMGLIVNIVKEEKIDFDKKKLKSIICVAPVLSIPLEIMKLAKWIKNYYLSDFFSVFKTIYPGTLKLNYSKRAIYLKDFDEDFKNLEAQKFNEYMKKRPEVTLNTLQKNFSKEIIEKAIKQKIISVEKKIILNSKISGKKKNKGKIVEKQIILNEEQENAVNTIKNSEKQLFLLKGVTGSGKTEIYINLIKEALKNGYGSIFLVPEISLTTQMIERLEEEFLDEVAILHSKLSDKEKREEWSFIRNGAKKIVIGARSAIFAPVQNLKYIIMDEEHENTYKQENNPRYHTKNVAIKRALLNENTKVKVILGSATPSFESFYQAKQGDLQLIELKKRFKNSKIPKYEIVDLNETTENFSEKLLEEISQTLKKKEQIILILNRKAFSNFLKCKSCQNIPTCPNCSISLTYYKKTNQLKCHYCGYEEHFSGFCKECGSEKMQQMGAGTEKVEEELKKFFPTVKMIRVDSETMKTKSDYEKIYNDFKNQKYDIMLGTQVIAKGLHFPNVTLVGIINADIILNFPDFRAGEKTFQLLTQASGRAGRGSKDGKVIIQTFNENNDVIAKTIENDYEGYYKNELFLRKSFNYPPFGRLIAVVISSKKEDLAQKKANDFYKTISKIVDENMEISENEFISEPFCAPIFKINSRFRYQIYFKFNKENILKIKKIIKKYLAKFNDSNVRITVDVDPVNMM